MLRELLLVIQLYPLFMRVHLEMRVLYLDSAVQCSAESARADKLYVPIIYIVETQFISYRQA